MKGDSKRSTKATETADVIAITPAKDNSYIKGERDANGYFRTWSNRRGGWNLIVIGRFGFISPRVVPQDLHYSEMSEVGHVGDLCQRLENTPR